MNAAVWGVAASTVDQDTVRWRLTDPAGEELEFAHVIARWVADSDFRAAWISRLRAVRFDAYTWECPPVTSANATRPFECVFISTPALARMPPDPVAFAEHFRPDTRVVTFPNLGGDAILVAPCADAGGAHFSHLARFVATATSGQAHDFWHAVGVAMERRIGTSPVWLSTAGLGVAWLHVRLDSTPKYYRHDAYRRGKHDGR